MVEDGHTILNGSYYSSLNHIAAQHYLKKEVHQKGDSLLIHCFLYLLHRKLETNKSLAEFFWGLEYK